MSSTLSVGESMLVEQVLAQWGLENWDDAIAWMAEASPEDVASLLAALNSISD